MLDLGFTLKVVNTRLRHPSCFTSVVFVDIFSIYMCQRSAGTVFEATLAVLPVFSNKSKSNRFEFLVEFCSMLLDLIGNKFDIWFCAGC
ncbi:hypothetical protein BpHYR1_044754 [Brachionus plicatilis]|uniref:Uncharacterized protein n=1 Tax=Brachionus plicatilis TaxID=10195 RepID=A0A3M7Q420_BRAPC|nr:hypothetical protein BpHYR1_044754 [Brachionus plicatilis]